MIRERKNICQKCGKPSVGTLCRACKLEKAVEVSPKTCIECGSPFSAKRSGNLCAQCYTKKIEEQLIAAGGPKTLVCEYCGKEFPFKLVQATLKPYKVCSFTCASKKRALLKGYTKEAMITKISDYIKSKNKFCNLFEITNSLGIIGSQLKRYNIDLRKLNADLGFVEVVKNGNRSNAKKQYIVTILPEADLSEEDKLKKKLIHTKIVEYIRKKGSRVTIRELLKNIHIDYYTVWKKFDFKLSELHKEASVEYSRTSSYYEDLVYKKLSTSFKSGDIVRQKRYLGLVSDKGWGLRYDFYIKPINTLLEVDGEQHYSESLRGASGNKRDALKEEYACNNNIPLHRIRITPIETFEKRVDTLIERFKNNLEILKESELLETPPDNAEGNQQPINQQPELF